MSSIQLADVSIKFPIFREKQNVSLWQKMIGAGVERSLFFALNGVNLNLKDGDKLALLGKNGSGKSTLLKTLAGILPPSSGSVKVEGEIFPALSPAPGVIRGATCLQNIILQGLAFGKTGDELKDYIDDVSVFSELGDFLHSPFSSLSTGMKSRFAVATLKSMRPQLLFMDEWVGASDKRVLEKNKGLLSSLVQSSDIFVLASHRKELVRNHCNRALVLQEGQIIYEGEVEGAFEAAEE